MLVTSGLRRSHARSRETDDSLSSMLPLSDPEWDSERIQAACQSDRTGMILAAEHTRSPLQLMLRLGVVSRSSMLPLSDPGPQ
jgi:hypothetical protein